MDIRIPKVVINTRFEWFATPYASCDTSTIVSAFSDREYSRKEFVEMYVKGILIYEEWYFKLCMLRIRYYTLRVKFQIFNRVNLLFLGKTILYMITCVSRDVQRKLTSVTQVCEIEWSSSVWKKVKNLTKSPQTWEKKLQNKKFIILTKQSSRIW